MKRLLAWLPVWLVSADMVYGFVLNLMQSIALGQEKLPADGLPVAPAIAFSGLQVVANGGMILLVGFGFAMLWRLDRRLRHGELMTMDVLPVLGLLIVLVFSVPSVWEWGWAVWSLLGGRLTVAFDNWHYLVVALCQPCIAYMCIRRLIAYYRLKRRLLGHHQAA